MTLSIGVDCLSSTTVQSISFTEMPKGQSPIKLKNKKGTGLARPFKRASNG